MPGSFRLVWHEASEHPGEIQRLRASTSRLAGLKVREADSFESDLSGLSLSNSDTGTRSEPDATSVLLGRPQGADIGRGTIAGP